VGVSQTLLPLIQLINSLIRVAKATIQQQRNIEWFTKAASGVAGFRRNTCRRLQPMRVSRHHTWAARWRVRGTCETCTRAGDDMRAGSKWSRRRPSLCFCTTRTTPVVKCYTPQRRALFVSSFRSPCPYHRNLFCCSINIISSIPSLSLNSLLGTLTFTLTLHIHLTILISARWSAASFSAYKMDT